MLLLFIDISQFRSYSFVYSIPYLILALILLIIGKRQVLMCETNDISRQSKILLYFIFLIFFGLRWHIFSDSMAYEDEFYNIKPIFMLSYLQDHSYWWDPGFVLFSMLSKLVSSNFFFFVFLNTLLDIFLFSICLKKYSHNITLTLICFLAFSGILTEINLMRNIKAILLFIISISYIKDRKLIPFLLLNTLGYFFHSSALLFIPMYWVLHRKYNLKLIILVCFFSSIIYLFGGDYIKNIITNFLSTDSVAQKAFHYLDVEEENAFSIGNIERVITLLLGTYMVSKIPQKYDRKGHGNYK